MSEPRKKAEELVEKFYNVKTLTGFSQITEYEAIQCAILCVKEKIGTLTECHNFVPTSEITRQILIHEEVLTELNKM